MTSPGGRLLTAAMLVAVVVAGCDDDSASAANLVEVTAAAGSEYRFALPDELPDGPTQLTLANDGAEPHHAQVFQLGDGSSIDDLEAALTTGGPAAALEVGTFIGGTGLVDSGDESRADAVLDLDAGSYAVICLIPGPDNTPHVANGMVQAFEVVSAGTEPPAPEPADAAVELENYRFEIPEPLAGDALLDVTNASSSEPHELIVAGLEPDTTADDVADALDRGEPLPAAGTGGMQAILPGDSAQLRLRLDPGRYVLFCAVPSPDGTPHYRAGMLQEVTVQ
jgi:uncharacterized cupredoxin-like copper-binding protein